MITQCVVCKKDFDVPPSVLKRGSGKYCSWKCRKTSKKISCKRCGRKFLAKPSEIRTGKKYCSRKCFISSVTKKCLQCRKEFKANQCNIKKGFANFCSRPCACAFEKTKDHSRISGDKAWNWKGGKYLHNSGYILIYQPHHPRTKTNYVREHILVAEKCLNRFLDGKEVVHHINEIKSDNRPENLYLFATTGEHSSYHMNLLHGNVEPICESNLFHKN